MGYRTVMNVPRIADYKAAYKVWNNVKPVQGRSEDKRPLGQRRDVDTYSIRKNIWTDAIECVLYQTPVVTFTTEDEVKIKFGRWSSASTCQFIDRLLTGVRCNRLRGDVVLHFIDGTKAIVGDYEELVLIRGADGRWQPKHKQTLYDYRVNRKEANAVRKMVSQFKDYLAGVTKLKSEELVLGMGTHYEERKQVVRTTYAELVEVFGKQEDKDGLCRPDARHWDKLDEKPKYFPPEGGAATWQAYRDKTEKFFDLVKDDQDDNCRHQNYWIAFNILFVQGQQLWRRDTNMNVTVDVEHFNTILERTLFKMFSDRVFKRVALPEGKVPSGRYDDWVTTEED